MRQMEYLRGRKPLWEPAGSVWGASFTHLNLQYKITILITYLARSLERLRAKLDRVTAPHCYQNCYP